MTTKKAPMGRTRESRVLRLIEMVGERRRTDERGVVAVLVIISMSAFMFGAAGLGVDVSRWYLEAQRVQKAADAAALGAVTYLPQDMPSAVTMATTISTRNGYPNTGTSTVAAVPGSKSSQLRVTVCSTISNTFGPIFGKPKTTICRTAVADYTGPAPMGSPCNTFGNEPTAGSAVAATPIGSARGLTPLANCPVNPQFWATVEGPATDKIYGDRYQTVNCTSGVDGCVAGKNTEYDKEGYFWLVRVKQQAVDAGLPVDLQLFDPEFVNTNQTCPGLPKVWVSGSKTNAWLIDAANPYVTDAKTRYSPSSATGSSSVAPTCAGDLVTTGSSQMTTSFALRQQTDTLDPRKSAVQNDTSGNPCIKQYTGQLDDPTTTDLLEKNPGLTTDNTSYQTQLASVFHNWTSLCTFTPTRAGDYYLQVRTNIAATGPVTIPGQRGSTIIYKGNMNVVGATPNLTTGDGNNAFAIRAVTGSGLEQAVSVSGYDRMPIYANATGAASTLNLIRVLPGGAGKSIAFSYYDVGDIVGTGVGSVQVSTPPDATFTGTAFPNGGCKASGGKAGAGSTALTNCKAPFDAGSSGSNNGKTETIVIPIPSDYTCDYTKPENCWYRVTVTEPSGSTVNDITTWTANIFGDPVRLIE